MGAWATGPGAHLFTGTFDQTFIAAAIAYAACLDDGSGVQLPACQTPPVPDGRGLQGDVVSAQATADSVRRTLLQALGDLGRA